MANLVYYEKEREIFKEAFDRKMTLEEAEILFEKLCRHFKLNGIYQKVHLYWTSGSRCPKAFGTSAIKLNEDYNNFGVLCHELAHIRQRKKYGQTGHNRQHLRVMKTIVAYCKRRNWWEQELKERLAPRPTKPEPTQEELIAKTIERLERNCKRYTTKIRMYGNKLRKAQKKIGRLRAKIGKIEG